MVPGRNTVNVFAVKQFSWTDLLPYIPLAEIHASFSELEIDCSEVCPKLHVSH